MASDHPCQPGRGVKSGSEGIGHCALGSIHLGPGTSRSLSRCPSPVLYHETSPLGPRPLPSHPGGHCTKRPLQSLNRWMLGAQGAAHLEPQPFHSHLLKPFHFCPGHPAQLLCSLPAHSQQLPSLSFPHPKEEEHLCCSKLETLLRSSDRSQQVQIPTRTPQLWAGLPV